MKMRSRSLLVVVTSAIAFTSTLGAQEKPPVKDSVVTMAPFRLRLMGVYDDRTGEGVEGADIIDVMNGNSVKTSSTGTALLAFLPEGATLVRIRKLGYELQTMMVSISPEDTLPLTVILKKVTERAAVNVVDSAVRKYSSPKLQVFEER